MKTDRLIEALAADAATPPKRLRPALLAALAASALAAGLAFAALLGPRSDIAAALGAPRFVWKFVVTLALALAALALVMRIARPGREAGPALYGLAAALSLLALAVAAEMLTVPADAWATRLVGRNAWLCLVNIPVLSAAPLAALLLALRRGAPSSPARLGAAAGLLAGAVGATFYAAHCFDDSPLFVAVWYSLGIGAVTLAGAAIGARMLRW